MNNDLFEVNRIFESTEQTLTRVETTFVEVKFASRCDEQTRKRIESISPGKKKNDALSKLANFIRGQQPGSSIKRAVDIALSTDVELPIYEWLKKICKHAERLVSTEEKMIADGVVTEWKAENSDARVVGEYLYDITDSWKHYEEVMNGRNAGTKNVFLNLKKGNKTDFIRVINALYELGFFCDRLNAKITKQDVFKEFGKCVNVDLSDYQNLLSKSKKSCNNDGNSQQCIIFDAMKGTTMDKQKK